MIVVKLNYTAWVSIRSFLVDQGKVKFGQVTVWEEDFVLLAECGIRVEVRRSPQFIVKSVELHFESDETEMMFRLKYL